MKGDDKLFFWQAYYSSDNGNNWMTVSTFYSDEFKMYISKGGLAPKSIGFTKMSEWQLSSDSFH